MLDSVVCNAVDDACGLSMNLREVGWIGGISGIGGMLHEASGGVQQDGDAQCKHSANSDATGEIVLLNPEASYKCAQTTSQIGSLVMDGPTER